MTYVNLTDAEVAALGRTLDTDRLLTESERAVVSDLIESAGEIELDDEVVASRGADNGMYVMAWVWVDFPMCDCGAWTDAVDATECVVCREAASSIDQDYPESFGEDI